MNELELNLKYKVYGSTQEMDKEKSELAAESIKAAKKAYAPYSKFHVGAAVLMENGEIISGNNQENAAYPSGTCAERVAIFYASALQPGKRIKAIAVYAEGEESTYEEPVTPCGSCRQVLLEYENRQGINIPVIMTGVNGKVLEAPSISSLLPLAFGSFQLRGGQ